MESKMLGKEDLMEVLNYLATTKEVQMFHKYQRLLQEWIVKEQEAPQQAEASAE
jgi:hypothetical protein